MKLIEFNRKLIIVLLILTVGLYINLLRETDLFAKQNALFKSKITSLNKDLLKFKPWVTTRKYENFIEGKSIPSSILKNHIYKNYFSENSKRLSIILVGNSADCGTCTEKEIELWKDFFSQNSNSNISKFSIYHSKNQKSTDKFIEKYQEVFPVISDPTFSFLRQLEIQRTPVILFVVNNKIVYVHIPISEDEEKTENFIKKINRYPL
ncbi:redoxin family protein [candidate division KSB1 bacterium]